MKSLQNIHQLKRRMRIMVEPRAERLDGQVSRKTGDGYQGTPKDQYYSEARPMFFRSSIEGAWKAQNPPNTELNDERIENFVNLNPELVDRIRESSDDLRNIDPEHIFQYFQNQNKTGANNHKRSISYNLQNMEVTNTGTAPNHKHNA